MSNSTVQIGNVKDSDIIITQEVNRVDKRISEDKPSRTVVILSNEKYGEDIARLKKSVMGKIIEAAKKRWLETKNG